MTGVTRVSVLAAVAAATAIVDQTAKHLMFDRLAETGPTRHFAGLLRFELALNRGGFLGLGESLDPTVRWVVFTLAVTVALVATAWIALRGTSSVSSLVSFGLILGGGFGNLLDRVLLDGVVRDYAIVGIGPVRTGVFNLADTAILVGASVLILGSWLDSSTSDRSSSPA
ncbi:MAG: signal peptidase II [Thermoanaerobaculia bacterium]|nr:signal peptidase II [Thermoanaerobaculia bacterium]